MDDAGACFWGDDSFGVVSCSLYEEGSGLG